MKEDRARGNCGNEMRNHAFNFQASCLNVKVVLHILLVLISTKFIAPLVGFVRRESREMEIERVKMESRCNDKGKVCGLKKNVR